MSELQKFDFSKLDKDFTRFDFWEKYSIGTMPKTHPDRQTAVVVFDATAPAEPPHIVTYAELAKHFGVPTYMVRNDCNGLLYSEYQHDRSFEECSYTPVITAVNIKTTEDLLAGTQVVGRRSSLPCSVLAVKDGKLHTVEFRGTEGEDGSEIRIPVRNHKVDFSNPDLILDNVRGGWAIDADGYEKYPVLKNMFRIYRDGETVTSHTLHLDHLIGRWQTPVNMLLTDSAQVIRQLRDLLSDRIFVTEGQAAATREILSKPMTRENLHRYSVGYNRIYQLANLSTLYSHPLIDFDPSGEWIDVQNKDAGVTIRIMLKEVLLRMVVPYASQTVDGGEVGSF